MYRPGSQRAEDSGTGGPHRRRRRPDDRLPPALKGCLSQTATGVFEGAEDPGVPVAQDPPQAGGEHRFAEDERPGRVRVRRSCLVPQRLVLAGPGGFFQQVRHPSAGVGAHGQADDVRRAKAFLKHFGGVQRGGGEDEVHVRFGGAGDVGKGGVHRPGGDDVEALRGAPVQQGLDIADH